MLKFKVIPDEGPEYEVEVKPRDVLTWEKTTKGGKSINEWLVDPDYVNAYKLVHLAVWRQGLFKGSLKEFEAQHEIEGIGKDDEEPDPTQSDQSPES